MFRVKKIDFIHAVEKFETIHGRLSELGHQRTKLDSDLLLALLSDPIIRAYLGRDADEVEFAEDHPKFKFETHHPRKNSLEVIVLALVRSLFLPSADPSSIEFDEDYPEYSDEKELEIYEFFHNKIPFRGMTINSSEFYVTAPLNYHSGFVDRVLMAIEHPPGIQVYGPVDAYESSKSVRKSNGSASFQIFSTWDDIHATTLLSIIDPATHAVLAVVSINSVESESFFKTIKRKFFHNWKEEQCTLIGMSLHLQISPDDMNCVLYSINCVKGLVKLLGVPELSEELLRLAKAMYHEDSDLTIQQKEENLVAVLQQHLPHFLPEYFNPTGARKTQAELKKFHLKERWQMGKLFLDMNYPINTMPTLFADRTTTKPEEPSPPFQLVVNANGFYA